HAEGVADGVGPELGKALRAIAALEQESTTGGDLTQSLLKVPRLAGKNQGRQTPQPLFGGRQLGLVGVFRHLGDRLTAPALRHPFGTHRPCSFKKGMTLTDHRARGQLPSAYLAWVQVLGFNGTSIAETAIGTLVRYEKS